MVALIAYGHSLDLADEIRLWEVCGEENDLEGQEDYGRIGTPAHQQAYLRNIGGKEVVRCSEATISPPKREVPRRTPLDYGKG